MKYLFVFVFIVTLSSKSNSQEILLPTDSTKIVAIIDDWNKAWETKDYILATKGYSADTVFTNAFGDKRKGQSEIQLLLIVSHLISDARDKIAAKH